jgi:acetyl esterase/lipase
MAFMRSPVRSRSGPPSFLPLPKILLPLASFVIVSATAAMAQTSVPDAATWVANVAARYSITPNIPYLVTAHEAALDVYALRSPGKVPTPTVIYIHGGAWTGGDKSVAFLRTLPYLEMGWAVVNVNYRLGLAPAAVEDCRCALRWVIRNATKFNFDVNKLVVTGDSAGSHLALTTGLLPESAGLEGQCPGQEELKVAAVVNWYGVTDVVDLLEGPNQRTYAVRWLGSLPNREEIARRISPLRYVRAGLPPILTVHGDADPVAPYSHAVRLHKALDDVRVPNQLLTIPGGDHGSFTSEEFVRIYTAIREFLHAQGLSK